MENFCRFSIERKQPDVVKFDNRYYLYYTGVRPTSGKDVFENSSVNDFTGIGVAAADSPHGPFQRLSDKPILTVAPKSTDPAEPSPFDSYRIDDAALLVRDYDKCDRTKETLTKCV